MTSVEDLKVDLKGTATSQSSLDFQLDDAYFEALDQDEIIGGNVDVRLSVRKGAADIFSLIFSIKGQVVVQCDRCLDDLALSVEVEDTVKVRYAEKDEEDFDAETKTIPYSQRFYDVAWDIYESIELSLPLQRIHQEGDCNKEMLQKLQELGS